MSKHTPGEIPCAGGFLYPGACSDSCGSPYWEPDKGSRDGRTGHECCSTVAAVYAAMLEALKEVERHHVEINAKAMRAEDRSTTLRIVRAAIARAEGKP